MIGLDTRVCDNSPIFAWDAEYMFSVSMSIESPVAEVVTANPAPLPDVAMVATIIDCGESRARRIREKSLAKRKNERRTRNGKKERREDEKGNQNERI